MKINKKELSKIIKEEFQLELKKRNLKKRLNEVSQRLSILNEEFNAPDFSGYDSNLPIGIQDPALESDLEIDKYEFVNNNSDVEVSLKGYLPITIDGDSIVSMYELKAGKSFPSIMSVDEILTSFKNTNHDISEIILEFIEDNDIELEPYG